MNGSSGYGRESIFICTFPFLPWAEGSRAADMKPYRETSSQLTLHLEIYDDLEVSTHGRAHG